ncbi:MAG TPA: FKBP-type peptidyl-prolyl cis-trans isomerase [Pyrinomonadaceae bacterium]|jgi:peptidylprolyl isomerase|nr:FKBP-type peptidyl-prolyl cis-trans isomerase [Pyrinomonadaceae bacterium]
MRIGVAILAAIIVIAGVVYVITRRNATPVLSEITTPSGLRIQELKIGDGPTPKLGQKVKVHYIGRLENGQEFNNSYKGGAPVEFSLGPGLIQGWNETLQTMKVGGKRRIFVPSKLAYGAQGRPPAIPPNANLDFDIELLGIN